ncbi:uncharacterized protein KY384_008864 [Bacidia gigantensis]|uniref:uncharacterized protein n=1 Tax=Bacidia gigantensis TaxID=2732470 RepID=UPI001D0557A7|nr:uncharacterized protein KY384_008864 [Bacidia gigantensis]KAG8525220.1 hypothetical protein KY384_008864 [Bacidia gigantensis]
MTTPIQLGWAYRVDGPKLLAWVSAFKKIQEQTQAFKICCEKARDRSLCLGKFPSEIIDAILSTVEYETFLSRYLECAPRNPWKTSDSGLQEWNKYYSSEYDNANEVAEEHYLNSEEDLNLGPVDGITDDVRGFYQDYRDGPGYQARIFGSLVEFEQCRQIFTQIFGLKPVFTCSGSMSYGFQSMYDLRGYLTIPLGKPSQMQVKFDMYSPGIAILLYDGVIGLSQIHPLSEKAIAKFTMALNRLDISRPGEKRREWKPRNKVCRPASPVFDSEIDSRTQLDTSSQPDQPLAEQDNHRDGSDAFTDGPTLMILACDLFQNHN